MFSKMYRLLFQERLKIRMSEMVQREYQNFTSYLISLSIMPSYIRYLIILY